MKKNQREKKNINFYDENPKKQLKVKIGFHFSFR